MPDTSHTFNIRVYYEDTDTGGIVYYANYLRYAERARTEVLRSAGINQTDLMAQSNIAFAVRKCEIEYHKPARLDDMLTIHTTLEKIGNASLNMHQTICKADETLVSLRIKVAVIDGTLKPTKLPPALRTALSQTYQHA